MEFIVQLGTVETNATTWLKTLRIVINLTRGVSWTDGEIKTNILEITMGHGYLIEWPCDVLDTGSHYIFCLRLQMLLQRRSTADTHSIVRVRILSFGGAGGFGRMKLTTYCKKETWFHCVHFIFWCGKLHHNVSLCSWHTKYATMYELTCFRVARIQCHVVYNKTIFTLFRSSTEICWTF